MFKLRKMFDEENLELAPRDVAAKLHVAPRNAIEYLKILKDEGFIYIKDHRRDGSRGKWIKVFARRRSEDDVDATPPRRQTDAEIRRKIRAVPERWQAELQWQRKRAKAKKFMADGVSLDPLMAALHRDATITV